jgi:hypothetical protein
MIEIRTRTERAAVSARIARPEHHNTNFDEEGEGY